MDKNKELDELFDKVSKCNKCINLKNKSGTDCSLINIYIQKNFFKNIPSIWTDWYRRLDSQIMIIGQDWGPYSEMNKIFNKYIKKADEINWNNFIEEEKSLTKRMLTKYFLESAKQNKINIEDNFLENIYITNGILCARNGENYRGNNINLKKSSLNCKEFLKEQVNIVNLKIILPLGYYPLYELSQIYNFEIGKTLRENIDREIKIKNFVIIPIYHPAAQINREEQLKQYNKIWKYY